jgi:excisionase family DNA binding protein
MMTVNEVAVELKVSAKFVYSICSKGLLESFKIGGRIRIARDAVDRYLDSNKNGATHLPVSTPRTQLKRLRLR